MDLQTLPTIVSILLGGGILGFIQFLLKRKYEKEDKHDEVIEAINKLDEKVDEKFIALDRQSTERFDELNKKIDEVDKKGDERAAVSSRVRILRFRDEMLEGKSHTHDSFQQVLTDIDDYEQYCETHPDFKNNQTLRTIEHIKANYDERLNKNDFL